MDAKISRWTWGLKPAPLSADGPLPDTKKAKRSWRSFFRDLFLYFVVYLVISGLSIGPLFWVWFGAVYVDGPKWFARLYMPLAFLCEICPPLGWLVNSWINWWIL